MSPVALQGSPASPGQALGSAWRSIDPSNGGVVIPEADRETELERARDALARVAHGLSELAAGLPPQEAAIVEAGILMAEDPALLDGVAAAIVSEGLTAVAAIIHATDEHARALESIDDERLALRADDVRSIGRRAARLLASQDETNAPSKSDLVLIDRDLGPADVAEYASSLAGVALIGGGATAHAAIVARSLGIPMVTGLPEELLAVANGTPVTLDGATGVVVVDPSVAESARARAHMQSRRRTTAIARSQRELPAITTDGRRISVLANVASAAELEAGLAAGAEGIGLLRTELAFLDASAWPTEHEHHEALAPILAGLGDRPAVVRVLDFGADKAPPFLHGTAERGLPLLLAQPDAVRAQLRAILRFCAAGVDVRVLLPMVENPEQVAALRALAAEAAAGVGVDALPPIGSMIETPCAARDAAAISAQSNFLSIGTNDLTASILGADRFAVNTACAHHPSVLRAIAGCVAAAHRAGLSIEVCGESASDPVMLPLLVGLGLDEVSVGAARVGEVRQWVRRLSAVRVESLARRACELRSAEEVAALVSSSTGDPELLSA